MTKCKKCGATLHLSDQVMEWDDMFGDNWQGEAIINIICPKCEEGVMMIDLVMYDETEDVKSPMGIIKVPKFKKHGKKRNKV